VKPLQLNMSKMKKVSGDKYSSTFMHDDGHQMIIAHAKLPAMQRKQMEALPIQKMAGGGLAQEASNFFSTPPTPTPKPETQDEKYARIRQQNTQNVSASPPPQAQDYSKGGVVEHRANNPKLQQSIMTNPVPEAQKEALHYYESGSDQGPVSSDDGKQPININVGQPQSPASVFAQTPVNAQVQPSTAHPSNLMFPNGTLNAPAAAQLEQKAAGEQQAVDTAKSAAMAPVEDAAVKARAAIGQQVQDNLTNFTQHTDAAADAIQKGLINPNHYMESMGSGKKVATGLGLLLGGFGAQFGKTGTNPAMDFLNRQIDRDIDAQKARSEQQKTIYGMYHDVYGAGNTTNALTKATMDDIYAHKASQIAAQLGTPQAQALRDQFVAQKMQEKNQLLLDASQNAVLETAKPGQAAPAGNESPGVPVPFIDQNGKMQGRPAQPNQQSETPSQENDDFSKPGSKATFPILAPGAENFAKYGARLHPFAKQDAGEINNQIRQARQAEKIINGPKGDGTGGIHDLFDQMYTTTGRGSQILGAAGALQRAGNAGVGAVMGAASHLLGGGAGADAASMIGGSGVIPPLSASQRAYETMQSRLKTDIASGLKGLISVHDIDALVNRFTPSYRDTPQDVKRKEDALIAAIRNAIPSDKLEEYKLLHKQE
jgi:hypothetical protein